MLRDARAEELKPWVKVAAVLWTMELYGEWWKTMGFDSKADALAQPEFQLSPSTAAQYVACYEIFRDVDKELLQRSRPRLLFSALERDKGGAWFIRSGATPEKAAQDATALSWSAYQELHGKPRSKP
jgi:hypothetical protein